MGSLYVAQANFELMIFLPQPSEHWDCKCASPCVTSAAHFFNAFVVEL
jgi:hypothetical protein